MATNSSATPPSPSRSHSGSRSPRVIRRTPDSSRSSPYPNPNPNNRARRRAFARRWDWLHDTLSTWRDSEGIVTTSDPMDISPYTHEPIHHTVPVLAARIHRHEGRFNDIEMEQHHLEDRMNDIELDHQEMHANWTQLAPERIAQIRRDQEDITETMTAVHNQVIGNSLEISVLQTRLVESETRILEAEDHARMMEQRQEQSIRMITRLAESLERVVTLLPPNPRQG